MKLTDTLCRKAAATSAPLKLADGNGLFLYVSVAGSKVWQWQYRHAGKQRTLTFGPYPRITLAEARDRRDRSRILLRDGQDPAAPDAQAKVETGPQGPTFASVCERWFEVRRKSVSPKTFERLENRMRADALPVLGDKPIAEITTRDVLDMARKIEARGAIETAKRIKNHVGEVFRFAIPEGLCQHDPSRDVNDALTKKPPVKHRSALRARDLPSFMSRLDRYSGDLVTKQALLLTLYTFVRTNETRFAVWSEFEGLDSDTPLWRIPAERMKMGLEHLVPLSRQVVALLSEIKQQAGDSAFLFPSPTKTGTLSENTMLYGMYRMGYHSRATVHGLRRTASTILNESNLFHKDWIERQLAHVEENQVRGAYNAAEYLSHRRAMMQWWSDFLDRQLEEDLIG